MTNLTRIQGKSPASTCVTDEDSWISQYHQWLLGRFQSQIYRPLEAHYNPFNAPGGVTQKVTFTPQLLEPRIGYIRLPHCREKVCKETIVLSWLFHTYPISFVLTLASEVLWQAPHRCSIALERILLDI